MIKRNLLILLLLLTASAFSASKPILAEQVCNWRDRPSFLQCIRNKFDGTPIIYLDKFLSGEGFTLLEQRDGKDYLYYLRESNDLGGYRVALLVWVDNNSSIIRIEIR